MTAAFSASGIFPGGPDPSAVVLGTASHSIIHTPGLVGQHVAELGLDHRRVVAHLTLVMPRFGPGPRPPAMAMVPVDRFALTSGRRSRPRLDRPSRPASGTVAVEVLEGGGGGSRPATVADTGRRSRDHEAGRNPCTAGAAPFMATPPARCAVVAPRSGTRRWGRRRASDDWVALVCTPLGSSSVARDALPDGVGRGCCRPRSRRERVTSHLRHRRRSSVSSNGCRPCC
jgi:hypothetical protein